MNLKRGEADEATIKLAGADTNVKKRIAEIKINAVKIKASTGALPTPGDIVGSGRMKPVGAMQLEGGLQVHCGLQAQGAGDPPSSVYTGRGL